MPLPREQAEPHQGGSVGSCIEGMTFTQEQQGCQRSGHTPEASVQLLVSTPHSRGGFILCSRMRQGHHIDGSGPSLQTGCWSDWSSGKPSDCLTMGVSHATPVVKPNRNAFRTVHPQTKCSRSVAESSSTQEGIGGGICWGFKNLRCVLEEDCGTWSHPASLLHPIYEVGGLP